jgi:hypothetical protein
VWWKVVKVSSGTKVPNGYVNSAHVTHLFVANVGSGNDLIAVEVADRPSTADQLYLDTSFFTDDAVADAFIKTVVQGYDPEELE